MPREHLLEVPRSRAWVIVMAHIRRCSPAGEKILRGTPRGVLDAATDNGADFSIRTDSVSLRAWLRC